MRYQWEFQDIHDTEKKTNLRIIGPKGESSSKNREHAGGTSPQVAALTLSEEPSSVPRTLSSNLL